MANKKNYTLTMEPSIFNGLKTLALLQGKSVSAILEDLGKQYVVEHTPELQNYFQKQLDLFEWLESQASPQSNNSTDK